MYESPHDRESSTIPFEHAILDIALSAVVKRLRYATDKLDANRQVVDQLTCNVDRETLVSVRMLKNEQQELLERVAVVLECLEHTAGTYPSHPSIVIALCCLHFHPIQQFRVSRSCHIRNSPQQLRKHTSRWWGYKCRGEDASSSLPYTQGCISIPRAEHACHRGQQGAHAR